jgi:hypothetical protein
LQKAGKRKAREWRPSAICISKDSFERDTAFKLLNWISYKYGFGTYLHRIEGYYSKATYQQSQEELDKLLNSFDKIENHVYVDTIISPSYTSAIAQAIQLPGIAGMENNMVIFEFDKEDPERLDLIIENYSLARAGNFDFCILGSSRRKFNYKKSIHVWIKSSDTDNANLMILLSFIIGGHPDWNKADIQIFNICKESQADETRKQLDELVVSGRLPITNSNIEIIHEQENIASRDIINEKSADAGLTILGFRGESLKHEKSELFKGYDALGNILFINSNSRKDID